MNRKNILEIARALIDKVVGFDMNDPSFGVNRICGSAGCIAGHIAWLHPRIRVGVTLDHLGGEITAHPEVIQNYFRISEDDAVSIFFGGDNDNTLGMTRWTAAAALALYAWDKRINFDETSKRRAIALVEAAEKEFLQA